MKLTRTAELFLFDTCTHKCAYCHLAETGKVLDNSQTRPFKDLDFIKKIADFFTSRTNEDENWLLTLTGGEPLLMPNLRQFVDKIGEAGNKVAFYSALLVGEHTDQYKYLMTDGVKYTDYIMASFHPEAEQIEEKFFEKLRSLKSVGHNIIFRIVGHPDRLERLDQLAEKCRALDIAFHPTTLFSPEYPNKYTEDQREILTKHFVSKNQYIQLNNGLKTENLKCHAGSKIISIDMRTGNITPCITVHKPILGNIYENDLKLYRDQIFCPEKGVPCICDIHFQQGIIPGADDREIFAKEKKGYIDPSVNSLSWSDYEANKLEYSEKQVTMGQTETAMFGALDQKFVKREYKKNKNHFESEYAIDNHKEFLTRQFSNDIVDKIEQQRNQILSKRARNEFLRRMIYGNSYDKPNLAQKYLKTLVTKIRNKS